MSPYAMLAVSVIFEVFADACMKLSDGFARKPPIIGIAVGYAVSFYMLSGALSAIPLGVAYAIWTSAAVVLTAAVGRVAWGELFNAKKAVGIALIVLGVAALRMGAPA